LAHGGVACVSCWLAVVVERLPTSPGPCHGL
jgi:hypothetical protein